MRKKFLKKIFSAAAAALLLISAVPVGTEAYSPQYSTIRVGLYYGTGALSSANLLNASGYGSGYKFGYYDSNRSFVEVGYTSVENLTMMKDTNMYLSSGTYYTSASGLSAYSTIGCYHIKLPDTYPDYDSAKAAAEAIAAEKGIGAFPAFYSGAYYVCAGSYTNSTLAAGAMAELGLTGEAFSASSSCIVVVQTSTAKILFEFDCGQEKSLAVLPVYDGGKAQTWFKGYKYNGGFQYTRLAGNNITVVNFVDVEDYVKGVIPYEMSASWHIEALKAQALCARSYGMVCAEQGTHRSSGFDVCSSDDCQVYRGTNSATDNSNKAVDDTAGEYVLYNGKLCTTYFHSSDGGATESSENVWGSALDYLVGKVDPYEENVNTGKKNWSFTYTNAELTKVLQDKGYSCSDIVSMTATYTGTGNVKSLIFTDSNGKVLTFSNDKTRSIISVTSTGKVTYSRHYTVTASGGGTGSGGDTVYVNSSSGTLSGDLSSAYAVGSGGSAVLGSDSVTVITGSGTETLTSGSAEPSSDEVVYTITGSGWGHNLGMSQYGALGMAKLGYTYDQIIKFYFTGVTIG